MKTITIEINDQDYADMIAHLTTGKPKRAGVPLVGVQFLVHVEDEPDPRELREDYPGQRITGPEDGWDPLNYTEDQLRDRKGEAK